uniref:Uncharacterized protein n=1 Tax=Brassica campestris TaxID=3711 RepID=M4E9M0_BRACM
MSFFDRQAVKFHKQLEAIRGGDPRVVVATGINPKFEGDSVLDLTINSVKIVVVTVFPTTTNRIGELRSRRMKNACKNGEADEQDFRTEKTTSSRKRRASKDKAKEMAQTEEGAVNGGKGRSLLLVLVF